jgi:putative ABC transport system ATP-binding protein
MPQLMFSIRKLRKKRRDGAGYTLDIDCLDVLRGERIAITGPSGCGKSTALDLLAGILRPDAADRFIFAPDDAVAVDMMDAWDAGRLDKLSLLRRRYLGYVLQTGGLLPFLSARDNITVVRRAVGLPDDTSVDELAERLGISRLLRVLPHKLSVGERQRVAIARALASRPALVLADEPTAALDPVNAQGVMNLFADLAREMGCTVILVTHAPEMARRLGFRECPFRLASIGGVEGGEEGGAVHALLGASAGGV